MPVLRKKPAVCRKIGENDGVHHIVCETEPGKVFEILIQKDGTSTLKPRSIIPTEDDYKKIREALRELGIGAVL